MIIASGSTGNDHERADAATMRDYDTGATRDDNTNKLSYSKGLSSQVLQRYLEYLGKHRGQADGKLRDWDNCGD